MPNSITLEVSHPDGRTGKIDGFKLFWAYYVNGFKPDEHCQKCFVGHVAPEFNSHTARSGHAIVLGEIDRSRYLYVCGVANGRDDERYRRNFHLPLRYEKGRSVSAATYNGYTVTATNAVLLQIPALQPGSVVDKHGEPVIESILRCKNFQFGVEYFWHPGLRGSKPVS